MSSQLNLPQHAASLPTSVRETLAHLESHGFPAWLTGESFMQLLLGQTPRAFEITTSASVDACLDQFALAVPTHPQRGVVTLATGDAPVDLSCRSDVSADLSRRDFTVLSMAYRLTEEELLDPNGGLADLQSARLRWVGDADAAIEADPLRMMRAARLTAEYGFDPADVEAAISRCPSPIRNVAAARTRRELIRTLLSDHPPAGLGLLRRTRLEDQLVRSVRADSADLVAALPRRLPLRMAAWLRGTRPRNLLRRLRFGLVRSRHIERLLEYHPLDESVNPNRDRALSRLLRLLEPADIDGLLEMREWELQHGADDSEVDVAAVRKKLSAIQHGIDRIRGNREREARRTQLAIDGQAIMELLRCAPGRRVGAALRFVSELVERDPSQNEASRLREALLAWNRENPERES